MQIDTLTAVSPIDGRYAGKCRELGEIFSEYGLVKRRVRVECAWLEALCDAREIRECRALSAAERRTLRGIADGFSLDDARRVKEIEKTTNHDVKAVEYFLKEKVAGTSLASRSGDSRNKYFQARGHGLARPRGVAAGQRLFIAASGRCPEAITTDGGWGFFRSRVWASKGPGGPLRAPQGRVTGPEPRFSECNLPRNN